MPRSWDWLRTNAEITWKQQNPQPIFGVQYFCLRLGWMRLLLCVGSTYEVEIPNHCRLQSCFDIVVSKTIWECVLRQRIDRVTYWWEDSTDGGGFGQSHGTLSSWRLTGSWEGDTDPWKWNTPWANPAHLVATLVIPLGDTAVQGSLSGQIMTHNFGPKIQFLKTCFDTISALCSLKFFKLVLLTCNDM